jgi:hypothetical protein
MDFASTCAIGADEVLVRYHRLPGLLKSDFIDDVITGNNPDIHISLLN